MDLTDIARWMFKLFLSEKDKVYLIIDRTNWYWGKQEINVFMLSVAYEGLALPLFWQLLNKGGCTNQYEQKTLIHLYIRLFGTQTIAGLLADREFANGELLNWLTNKKIGFYIRIKEGSVVCVKSKKLCKAKELFKNIRTKTTNVFNMSVHVLGVKVFISGARSPKGELVITNQFPKQAIEIYLRRWEIENLSQSLKSRGFRFEETHMTHLERIAKLMGLLAVAFAWTHKVDEWRASKKVIPFKKVTHFQTPQQTYSKYGLEFIRETVLHVYDANKQKILKNLIYILRLDSSTLINSVLITKKLSCRELMLQS